MIVQHHTKLKYFFQIHICISDSWCSGRNAIPDESVSIKLCNLYDSIKTYYGNIQWLKNAGLSKAKAHYRSTRPNQNARSFSKAEDIFTRSLFFHCFNNISAFANPPSPPSN